MILNEYCKLINTIIQFYGDLRTFLCYICVNKVMINIKCYHHFYMNLHAQYFLDMKQAMTQT